MPCNSEYMHPTPQEESSLEVIKLLSEIGIQVPHDRTYGDVGQLDFHVKTLCKFCQANDVTKYSLELQLWWRNHQAADAERLRKEVEAAEKREAKEKALAKLTPYEKKLLGL